MKGKTKLAFAFVVLALLAGSFLVFAPPTEAHSTESLEENGNTETSSYSACGGIQGCRTSCGCGCRGDPTLCGCGG